MFNATIRQTFTLIAALVPLASGATAGCGGGGSGTDGAGGNAPHAPSSGSGAGGAGRPEDPPAVTRAEYPDSILCPAQGGDPLCGAGYDPRSPMTATEHEQAMTKGLAAFRVQGAGGACANCHAPDGVDLAWIGYSDDTILRRAAAHVPVETAHAIVGLIHAVRQKYGIARPLHPMRYRPLQPGYEPLEPSGSAAAGGDEDARDLAFMEQMRDDLKLTIVTGRVETREEAAEAVAQIHDIDLRTMRTGIRFNLWSEDGFHGPDHHLISEWVPGLGRQPRTGKEGEWYGLVDAYLADPTDEKLWAFYDRIDELTERHADVPGAWMDVKYRSVQTAQHMLRHATLAYPDVFVGAPADPVGRRELAIARNPYWAVGDAVRINPLNCDTASDCMQFPAELDGTFNEGDEARREQTDSIKKSWFWAGWQHDPALLLSEDTKPTVVGDYFLSTLLPHTKVHHVFLVVKLAIEKAYAREWLHVPGKSLAGHGKWASPRPFLIFKHIENNLNHPPGGDPRFETHARMFANAARMFLHMVHQDIEQTGEIYRRGATLDAVHTLRTWLDDTEPGQDHANVDALIGRIEALAATAADIDDGFDD